MLMLRGPGWWERGLGGGRGDGYSFLRCEGGGVVGGSLGGEQKTLSFAGIAAQKLVETSFIVAFPLHQRPQL